MPKLPETAASERLDHAIAAALDGASIREVRTAMKEGRIQVNGRTRKPGDRAKGGEDIALVDFTPRVDAVVEPEPSPDIAVVFEDAKLLALSKPSGMPVAPLRAGEKHTLLAAAIAHAPQIAAAGPPLEGGLCHRLDVDTSGVVVFAKDTETRDAIRADFSAHAIQKRYLAIVSDPESALAEKSRTIDAPILGAGERVRVLDREQAEKHTDALEASTTVRVIERLRGAARLVEAVTSTGRRHQIRAHLASIGASIAGDTVYGGTPSLTPHLALHAERLTLRDGRTIAAPLPSDLAEAIARLRT